VSTWLITGCSTGLGRSLAQTVLEQGFNAVVTARNPATVEDIVAPYPETACSVALDVRNRDQITDAVRSAGDRFGGVDVLVNNAGHGYRAAVEEADDQDVAELFETNFFGAVDMTKAVLPGMRARKHGAIVNISSIGGRRAAAGSAFYSATKFALEGMSDALRKEVNPLGIKVIVVEPGAFRTDFAGRSLLQSGTAIDDYAETAGLRRKEKDTSHGTQRGDPWRAAQVVVKAVDAPDAPFRLLLGSDAVTVIREELTTQLQEVDSWQGTSISTDFPD
jgi:NAD(P)-dependent dehydrogenase (short-subunit alcohol dehydrogenase family)